MKIALFDSGLRYDNPNLRWATPLISSNPAIPAMWTLCLLNQPNQTKGTK
jgi:hypothetical protein